MKRQMVWVAAASLVIGVLVSQAPGWWQQWRGGAGGGADAGLISSFESDGDLKKWETNAARIERATEHATSGRYAGKATLFGGNQMCAIRIEDGFERRQAPRDWRRYERIEWKMFSTASQPERLILQLKDEDGRRFKKDIWLKPNAETVARVFLDTIGGSVGLGKIDQFSLFRWEPEGDLTFYIDDIRLLGKGQEAPGEPAADAAGGKAAKPSAAQSSAFTGSLGMFERDQELDAWMPVGAVATRATEHATQGRSSLKLLLRGGEGMSGVKMEDLPRGGNDWSRYQVLAIDGFNATNEQQRLLVELKDTDGKRFKHEIFFVPQQVQTAQVSLTAVDQALDLGQIAQVAIYAWDQSDDAVIFLDNIRVAKAGEVAAASTGGGKTDAVTATTATAASSLLKPARVPGFDARPERWTATESGDPLSAFIRAPISIDEQAGLDATAWPSSGGVPFPRGTLRPETPLRLRTADGAELPVQTRPLARWDDGSIKWLLVDTQADAQAGTRLAAFLDYGGTVASPPVAASLQVEETPEAIVVTTGPSRLRISRTRATLFDAVWLDRNGDGAFADDERLAGGGDLTMQHAGVVYRASRDAQTYRVTVEEQGPLRSVIRCSGWFRDESGNGFGQFIVRVHTFRGKPFVRLEHTFVYTGYPENKYHFVYEDKTLPSNETIQDIALELPVNIGATDGATCAFGDVKGVYQGAWKEPVELWQLDHNRFSVITVAGEAASGERLLGWLDVSSPTGGVTVALRDCWQQFPKTFEADPQRSTITVRLWPQRSGELDLKTTAEAYGPDAVARGSAFGLAKTHEMYWYFHAGSVKEAGVETFVRKVQEPSLVRALPEWVADSRALGWLHPYDKMARTEEGFMDTLFDWARRQPETYHWYGMIDYGDTLSWYRDHEEDGTAYPTPDWYPVGRWGWYNCEVTGMHTGALLQYVRTGQWSYFQFGDDTARHIQDIDTCHYNTVANDPRLRDVISDEYSKPGSMHRHNANHWGDRNEETSHTNIAGLTLYYYLTGSWRTLAVLQEVGEFMALEPITYSQHPDIAPQRSIANLLWSEALLYEVTGDQTHLERARKWAHFFADQQQPSGSWGEDYDPTTRSWRGESKTLYTTQYTLPALITYHRLTGDPRVVETIVKATDFMAGEPYLPMYHAFSYAYELTGELRYRRVAAERFKAAAESQRLGMDPMERGMIFQKPIYHRPNMFLYSLPYGIGLLAASDTQLQDWARDSKNVHSPQSIVHSSTPVGSAVDRGLSTMDAVTGSSAYRIGVASSLVKVFREPDRFPGAWEPPAITLSAAQGEYESAQLVLHSEATPLKGVTLSVGALKHVAGLEEMPLSTVTFRTVGYVQTQQPDYEVSHVGWWPDPLKVERSFAVTPGELAPVWVTVYVEPETLPGEYRGAIEVAVDGQPMRRVPLIVRVRNFTLPRRGHLATAFDFYSGRLEKAYREFYPEYYRSWRASLPELEDRFYHRMLHYRLSPVLNFDPTSTVVADRVRGYLEEGLNAVAVGSRGGSFDNEWPTDELSLNGLIPSYQVLGAALRGRGWLDLTYVYAYDEPPFGKPHVTQVTSMLHHAEPGLRTLVTLREMPDPREWTPEHLEWLKPIDIVCARNVTLTPRQVEALRGLGKRVWLYVSGPAPPYPTLVIDYPSIAYRVLPWMCWKYRVEGLLYWCVNFWRTDPWVEPMNTEWRQNGNGSLFYPGPDGPVDSIRLEVLRDGLEDYEYLWLLRGLVAEAERGAGAGAGSVPAGLMERAKRLVMVEDALVADFGTYTQDPTVMMARREAIAEAIEALIEQRARPSTAAAEVEASASASGER